MTSHDMTHGMTSHGMTHGMTSHDMTHGMTSRDAASEQRDVIHVCGWLCGCAVKNGVHLPLPHLPQWFVCWRSFGQTCH